MQLTLLDGEIRELGMVPDKQLATDVQFLRQLKKEVLNFRAVTGKIGTDFASLEDMLRDSFGVLVDKICEFDYDGWFKKIQHGHSEHMIQAHVTAWKNSVDDFCLVWFTDSLETSDVLQAAMRDSQLSIGNVIDQWDQEIRNRVRAQTHGVQ